VLWLVAGAFLLRGAAVVYNGYLLAQGAPNAVKDGIFSLVALVIGLCYLIGILSTKPDEW
jgi:hypothetical protein